MDKKAERIINLQINGFKSGILKCAEEFPSWLNTLLPLLATTGSASLLGSLAANPGKGLAGAGYGALQGLGIPIGGLLAALPASVLIGGPAGAIAALSTKGDRAEAGKQYGRFFGQNVGFPVGAVLGAYGTHNLIRKLYGEEKLKEIFG